MKRFLFLIFFLLLAVTAAENRVVAQAHSGKTLPGLRKAHPRLFLTSKRIKILEKESKNDPTLGKLIDLVTQNAEEILTESSVSRNPKKGPFLEQARSAVRRIWSLALAYRLTEDRRFLDAAVGEMQTVAKFKDWNPSHFLDTAEMTTAMAVGYDWLYDAMAPEDRKVVRQAIVELGLKAGLKSFETKHWWTTRENNWNQVCNGGMILGALAVAEEEPDVAKQMMDLCWKSLPKGLKAYQPDGAYPEGPGYWRYGTTYTVLTMLALESSFGQDFGIHKTQGLSSTATYPIHMSGPYHFLFNYADGSQITNPDFASFGLAYIYRQPIIAQTHLAYLTDYYQLNKKQTRRPKRRFFPLHVVYYPENQKLLKRHAKPLPLDVVFKGKQHVAAMRGKWDDRNATFLAIKGGDNQTTHGHLDIGSFVLDAVGTRWAADLGADNYGLPGYFDMKERRWNYYRMNHQSHNTLVIGNQLQNTKAISHIVDFHSSPSQAYVTIDMSDAYKGQAESVFRKASLLDRKQVVILDTIKAPSGEVRWGMVTRAKIALDGSKAVLTRSNKTMNVEIRSPKNARFKIVSTRPDSPREHPNSDAQMLAFTTKPDGAKTITLEVVFTPVD